VAEAEEMGLKVLPPDVNRSIDRFLPEEGNIRYGLAGIKSVGEGAAEAIVNERKARGPFTSFTTFCERVDPAAVNKRVLEALIKCGAMDSFGMHRARLFNNIEFALSRASEKLREKASGQSNLFDLLGAADSGSANPDHLPDVPKWNEKEYLTAERDLLGIYMTGHPLTRYRRIIKDLQTFSLAKLADASDNIDIRVAGLAATVTRRISKQSKEPWAVLVLDDGETSIEVLVFSEAFKKFEGACVPDQPVLICGALSKRDEQPKIIAREVYPLMDAPRVFGEKVIAGIKVEDGQSLKRIDELRQLSDKHPGTTPLLICLIYPDKKRILIQPDRSHTIDPSPEFITAAEAILGRNSMKFMAKKEIYKEPRPERRWSRDRAAS
jgi:DNA polymerase-3 subunit alpha